MIVFQRKKKIEVQLTKEKDFDHLRVNLLETLSLLTYLENELACNELLINLSFDYLFLVCKQDVYHRRNHKSRIRTSQGVQKI